MIVASVHAPFQFAWGGYTWFDMDQRFNPDESQFNASTNKLLTFIDDLQKAFSIPHDKLFLLGFSMGSIMSFSLALFRPELFRGVICLSGCILEHINAPYRWTALSGTSFFIGHGITDPIVPISLARRAHTLLTNASADTTYREYDGGHSISEECLSDVLEWLDEKLSSPPKKDTQ
jgi:phospholipase/carboxylesterase